MTTERTWYTSSIALENVSPLDMGSNLTIETYAVRKGSQVLWGIKESLVGTGHWEVVSCSFRNDATGSSGDNYLYPTQSLTAYGQNAAPVAAGNGVKFTVTGSDLWTTSSAVINAVAGRTGDDITKKEMHRLIYPAYSRTSDPVANTIVTSSAGRSWILLKNHTETLKQSGKNLYLVLDNCWNHYAGTQITSSVVSSSATGGRILPTGNFGRSLNLAAFYGEPENIATISEFQRPYRNDEISFVANAGGFAYNDWNTFVDPSTIGSLHINCVWNDEGGSYILVSQENTVTYALGIDLIADSLSSSLSSKATVGNVLFLSHASKIRGDMNRNNASYLPDLFAKSRSTIDGELTTPSESWFSPLKYFKTVSTTSFTGSLVCLLPMIGNTIKATDTPAPFLSVNTPGSGVTSDNTYVEYPVGLLDVSGVKWRYVGRFADIKLGPSAGINGTMARNPVSLEYDRFLAGGFWFPWAGTEPVEL
jgi:hypothetical protein